MYIAQVLDGLVYLHDQGVIHRDIKGANILATKDGLVKLADFGVATLSNDISDMSVAGTPYWSKDLISRVAFISAPKDGDVSVGCTVIELLDGEPPYHDLPPMGALYRIVQDDHPPIPESVSVASGSQRSREKAIPAYEEAVKDVKQWNEALNGSSISTNRNSGNFRRSLGEKNGRSWEHGVPAITDIFHAPKPQGRAPAMAEPPQFRLQINNANNVTAAKNNNYEPETDADNWDDDFADGISSFQLAAREFLDQDDEGPKTIRAAPETLAHLADNSENDIDEDDFEDDDQELQLKIRVKPLGGKTKSTSKQQETIVKAGGSLAARAKNVGSYVPIDLVRSRSAPGQLALEPLPINDEFQNYREDEDDDYSDLLEGVERQGAMYQDEGLTLQTRLSNQSWYGNDAGSDEEDPFAEVDEGFDEIDLEANIAREKHAKICENISKQFRLLETQQAGRELEEVCDRLISLLTENPNIRGPMIANHGAIPLLDLIENSKPHTLIQKLLNILNLVIRKDFALQESLCLVGAIPVVIRYTSKKYSKNIQFAAAVFIQQICHTNPLTLQMFISCRGLGVLIDFLQGNYTTQKDLVWIAIDGIHSVFNLQSMTPRNDFCRLLAKQGLLDPLSTTLYNTIHDPQGASYTEKIVQVLLIFSQGDSPVKELLATRQIVHRMLSSLQNLPIELCVVMLKCIKNISMNSNTLDVLQNANAIHTLVQVLGERTGRFATDISNHVLTTLFNLCRINKSRQQEAAQAGIIPHLQQIAESSSPLKQFALPILCDMAHAGRACRNILWNNDCLPSYLRIFKDPYWQVNAMDAVLVWLQDETADVEQALLQPSSLNMFVQAFSTAKANSFENILEPLYKIIRLSPDIARGIAVPALFHRLLDRLAHPKAVVRLNLLRILRAIFDVHPERIQLVVRYGIAGVVNRIAKEDSAVLVKELAREILVAFEESDSEAVLSGDEKDRGVNGYDSFASTGDFFGLGPMKNLADTIKMEGKDLSEEKMPSQQHTLFGKFKDREPDLDPHHVDDLFQQKVNNLDINTGLDYRTSSHQRGFGLEGNGEGSSAQLRHRLVPPRSLNDEEGDSSGSEEHFVTTRPWIDGTDPSMSTVKQEKHVTLDADLDLEDNEPRTIKVSRPFSHQKSKSLSEILIEERKQLRKPEGVTNDMTESMILRSELPKIRLELLDIEHFPAWNRRDLEAEYENDDDNDSDEVTATRGIGKAGRGHVRPSWSESHQELRMTRLQGTTNEPDLSIEEQNNMMRGFQGPRRRLSMDDKVRSTISNNAGSIRRSSGSNSSEPTVRYRVTPFSSISSPDFYGNIQIKRQPPSLASIVGWNTAPGATVRTEEVIKVPSSPGLVLAKRQEYDDTLNFSDDDDDDDDDDGDKGEEEEIDDDEAGDEDGGDNNDDDNDGGDSNDDDDDDEEDEDTYQSASEDDYENQTIKASVITLHSSAHGAHGIRYGGTNDLDDNAFDDDDDKKTHPNLDRSPGRGNNHSTNYGGYLMEEGEIDWDLEEVRKGYEPPATVKKTTTTIVTSPLTSPLTSPPTSPTSQLRRRTSHRKSPE
ncbi:hypothetical protein BGZ80_008209 [Entomortierella chlamydospora]|uniref:Protein kinase domain-containing protein n=1 Tax=Entomortierella chlamydospora TaxID=101097 RepID=A0A9P6MYN5_9FUNG|nr:hypothetical protein BGZ80_008209 [Entomortierella chlamydospora]